MPGLALADATIYNHMNMSVIGALPLPSRHAQLATSQVMDHIFQPHAQHKKSFFSFLRSFRSSSFSCPTKHSPLFKKANKMISARKLIKLARKWQKLAAIKRKRITFSSTSSMVEKGHFVVIALMRSALCFLWNI
ncbi:hypothetical protein PVK06_006452 [Gossypium arboreum]|uniref:Uncharacterized protein n=1 Tax=Gossypium arboreum TaxID=29729 RepID=A0ABR0QES2_GOSAR|nr:hypothetical protein PVK06_006452 [Gossypium arboreum]